MDINNSFFNIQVYNPGNYLNPNSNIQSKDGLDIYKPDEKTSQMGTCKDDSECQNPRMPKF